MSKDKGSLFSADDLGDTASGERLKSLHIRMSACVGCELSQSRNRVVTGSGGLRPDLALVVEAPGPDEDQQGRLFVGFSGQRYMKLVRKCGLDPADLFLCSVVACRPPLNRAPCLNEAQACVDFLYGQLRAVKPLTVMTLGKLATFMLIRSPKQYGDLVGKWQKWEGVPIMPSYAPVFLMGEGREFEKDAKQHLLSAVTRIKELKRGHKIHG